MGIGVPDVTACLVLVIPAAPATRAAEATQGRRPRVEIMNGLKRLDGRAEKPALRACCVKLFRGCDPKNAVIRSAVGD